MSEPWLPSEMKSRYLAYEGSIYDVGQKSVSLERNGMHAGRRASLSCHADPSFSGNSSNHPATGGAAGRRSLVLHLVLRIFPTWPPRPLQRSIRAGWAIRAGELPDVVLWHAVLRRIKR